MQSRYRIFVKGYGLLSFAQNMDKNIVKNICKSVSGGKYSLKRIDHAKQPATGALRTISRKVIQKAAETVGN